MFCGAYLYTWLGLGATASVTPNNLSVFALSLISIMIVPVFLYGTGAYEYQAFTNFRIASLRLLSTFVFSAPCVALLWYVSDFDYRPSFIIPVTVAALQIGMIALLRIGLQVLKLERILGVRAAVLGTEQFIHAADEIAENALFPLRIIRPSPYEELFADPKFDLAGYCLQKDINMLIVCGSSAVFPMEKLVACRFAGVEVLDFSFFAERETGRVEPERVYPQWIFYSGALSPKPIYNFFKRLFDIVFAGGLLILSAPVHILAAFLIHRQDRGPVYYSQTRTGLKGKPFRVYKLRSMRTDAEKNGAQWAQENDDRITPIGKWIRKTRLDELPQLYNILKGDMSVTGPRPERPEFVEELAKEIPFYKERHYVKPGLTGWAQINADYGASVEDTRRKLEYDLYYMKYAGFTLDVLIALKTLKVVLEGKGAR